MKLAITTTYTISTDTVFDMPEGRSWDDVADAFVRWGRLLITFKDGETLDLDTDHSTLDNVDFKNPDCMVVRPCDDNDSPDFDAEPLMEVRA